MVHKTLIRILKLNLCEEDSFDNRRKVNVMVWAHTPNLTCHQCRLVVPSSTRHGESGLLSPPNKLNTVRPALRTGTRLVLVAPNASQDYKQERCEMTNLSIIAWYIAWRTRHRGASSSANSRETRGHCGHCSPDPKRWPHCSSTSMPLVGSGIL